MNNIYKQAMEAVSNGFRFRVDFPKRSLTIGKRAVINEGVFNGDLGIAVHPSPLSEIERLFRIYRHSLPSERSESKRRKYFRALSADELSDEDMMFGTPREIAQAELELFILGQIILGNLNWNEFADGHWFWQSKQIPSLILLKEWINPAINN